MAHAQGARSWLRRVRAALYLFVAAGVVVTALPALDTEAWWVRVLDFPRVQFLAALALLLGLLLLLPGRFRPASLAAAAATMLCLAWQVSILWPYAPLMPRPQMMAAPPECPSAARLRVVAANVRMTNENAERLFAILRETDPDLILLQETDAWWDARLGALAERWPHGAERITQNYYGMHILSRYRLVEPEVHFLTSSRDPSIFTGVMLPAGQVIRFYGVHPRPPLPGQSSTQRDGQLLAAALAARQDGRPAVLAGDFNAVPWEDVVHRLERIGGLLSPRLGRGWLPTYRTGSRLMTWPLDHILAGPQFTLGRLEALADFGSDHRPVLADLCFMPEAAQMQAARPLEPGDIAAAREAVAAAQGRAAPSPEPPEGSQVPQPGRS